MKYNSSKTLNRFIHKPTRQYEKYNDVLIKLKNKPNHKLLKAVNKPINYKSYTRFEEVFLPKPILANKTSIKKMLVERMSSRTFTKEKIDLLSLSTLLYFSAGQHPIKKIKRFYPSAGALYPLEVYFLSLNTDLSEGLYHYYVRNHSLEYMYSVKRTDLKKYFSLPWVKTSGGVIFITSLFERSATKYGEFAYKFALLETGHMTQNMYLLAPSLNLKICTINGYRDYEINRLIDIDGIFETIISSVVIGR